jgi:exodeoxyribonuclease-3
MVRVITCNVNGIRSAHQKGFANWVLAQKPDVVCLQEVKATEDVVPPECKAPKGYFTYYHPAEKPGYSGVAVWTRRAPDKVKIGLDAGWIDTEGRYLQLDFGKLSVASVYFPSGSSGETRQQVKFRFLDHFGTFARDIRKKRRNYIFCGDFNIAHKEIDLKNWKSNQKNSGFLPEERAWLDRLFSHGGYIDGFREVNSEPDQYTWWSNRGQARAKNVGWRIDYHVLSKSLTGSVLGASIYRKERFSDHAPLTLDYDL